MFGAITITAIALAHAVSRPPASKNEGWALTPAFLQAHADAVTTDKTFSSTHAESEESSYLAFPSSIQSLSKISQISAELDEYRRLDAGWDGEDSESPDLSHIDAAINLLAFLPGGIPLPKPMVSADGEIGLFWKTTEYLADAVVEDERHFSLFLRSLKPGNKEIFLPSLLIEAGSANAVATAFKAL